MHVSFSCTRTNKTHRKTNRRLFRFRCLDDNNLSSPPHTSFHQKKTADKIFEQIRKLQEENDKLKQDLGETAKMVLEKATDELPLPDPSSDKAKQALDYLGGSSTKSAYLGGAEVYVGDDELKVGGGGGETGTATERFFACLRPGCRLSTYYATHSWRTPLDQSHVHMTGLCVAAICSAARVPGLNYHFVQQLRRKFIFWKDFTERRKYTKTLHAS